MDNNADTDFLLTPGQPVLDDGEAARGIAAALYGAMVPFAIHAIRFEERVARADGRKGYIPSEDEDCHEFYLLIGDVRRALNASLAYNLLSNGWTYRTPDEGYEGQDAGLWEGPGGEKFIVLTDGVQVPVISCELRRHVLGKYAAGAAGSKAQSS